MIPSVELFLWRQRKTERERGGVRGETERGSSGVSRVGLKGGFQQSQI